jgi:two-component system, LytTR family, sensor kinase
VKPKVKMFLTRSAWGTLLTLFLIFLFHFFAFSDTPAFKGIHAYLMPLWVIFLVNFLFQGLLWLDRRLDRSIPWYFYPRKRLLTELSIAFPSTLVIISLNYFFLHSQSDTNVRLTSHQRFLYIYIILMLVLTAAICIVIAGNFFRNWRTSLLEVEQLKQEKIKTAYQALQNQLNPHFLFNNFNMLLSEIRRDPANAVLITEKLADVYRYVLESKNHETVSLREEAEFIEALIFLSKIRFGANLAIDVQLPSDGLEFRLPPLTLQILIENALKHNIVSADHSLHIRIGVENDYLVVDNNIQLRKSTYSTGLGLENIKRRYSFLTEQKVTVETDDNRFIVKAPLLKVEQ